MPRVFLPIALFIFATICQAAEATPVKLLCDAKADRPSFGYGSDILDSPAVVQFDEQQRTISVEIPARHPDYSICHCSGGRTYPTVYHSDSATFTPDQISFEAHDEGGGAPPNSTEGVTINRLTGELTFSIHPTTAPEFQGTVLICHAAKAQF